MPVPRPLVAGAVITLFAGIAAAADAPLRPSPFWEDIRQDVIGATPIVMSTGLLDAETPTRAPDPAKVPLRIRQTDPTVPITRAIVVIDENPAPLAATFDFGAAMFPVEFETNLRVNQYSNLRVLGQTAQGLVMDGGYVKASGGCSAPAAGDAELAAATMGQMDLRQSPLRDGNRVRAELRISHPNNSGLQRDQITHLFVPAHFVNTMTVTQGDETLFTMSAGISVSENPVFRFAYRDDGSPALVVTATDTEGNIWRSVLPKTGS